MIAICSHCRRQFVPKYASLKLCFDCYKKREVAFAEYDGLIARLARPERLTQLSTRDDAGPVPDDDTLRFMVQQLHPDKHGQRPAANAATAWLNGLRRRRVSS